MNEVSPQLYSVYVIFLAMDVDLSHNEKGIVTSSTNANDTIAHLGSAFVAVGQFKTIFRTQNNSLI